MTPPYRLVNASAIDFLRNIDDETFHAGCTSIPYWMQRKYPVPGAYGQEPTREAWADNQVAVFDEVRRVLRNDGTFFVVVGEASTNRKSDSALKRGEVSLQATYLAERLRGAGWWVKALVVLEFSNRPPVPFYNRPAQSHEYAILISKQEDSYFWDYISSREPGVAHDRLSRTVWTGPVEKSYRPRCDPEFKHTSTYPRWIPDRYLSAAVSEAGVCGRCGTPRAPVIQESSGGSKGKSWHDHTNDKERGNAKSVSSKGYQPAVITGWKRGCRCRPSPTAPSLVLDPYTGTSTTGLVAMSRGCAYIGIDIDPRCIKASNERLSDHAEFLKTPLFDSRKAARRQTTMLPATEDE